MRPRRAAPGVPLVYQPLCWRPSVYDSNHCGIELMHVGTDGALRVADGAVVPVVCRTGDVVGTILETAAERRVDLIAMPTAGHHGFLDAIQHHRAGAAPCALPGPGG